MNNKIQQLFTKSLQPSIPNGQTIRSFKRVVLTETDSVGMNTDIMENWPLGVQAGGLVVISDGKGPARIQSSSHDDASWFRS